MSRLSYTQESVATDTSVNKTHHMFSKKETGFTPEAVNS